MNRLLVIFTIALALLAGCRPSKSPEVIRVEQMREKLPFVSRVKSSESMTGYSAGDRLMVSDSPYSAIKPGDHVYVWYTHSPIPYFHVAVRAVYSEMPPHNRWLIRGTANPRPDTELMTEETYVGRWDKIPEAGAKP